MTQNIQVVVTASEFMQGTTMPDISLCSGTNCNLKENCYRYKAIPNPYRQSYFANPPLKEDGSCKYFWQIESNIPKDFFDE